MARMILSKTELAMAFQVSTQALDGWVCQGCPRLAGGVPGVKCQLDWNAVENWAYQYKTWRNYGDPDLIIGAAYHRARAIVKARAKTAKRGSNGQADRSTVQPPVDVELVVIVDRGEASWFQHHGTCQHGTPSQLSPSE